MLTELRNLLSEVIASLLLNIYTTNMNKDELIKKLEQSQKPQISLPGHKERLKAVLMLEFRKRNTRCSVFYSLQIFKRTAFVGVGIAVLFLVFFGSNVFLAQASMAKAKNIVLNDPEVKKISDSALDIKDIKLIDGKAFVLIVPSKKISAATVGQESKILKDSNQEFAEESTAIVAKVDLKTKKVESVEDVATPEVRQLSGEEKERAKDILNKNISQQGGKESLKQAQIFQINAVPPKLKLIKKGASVQVTQEQKYDEEAVMILESDNVQWVGKVNLSKERVESLEINTQNP